MSQNARFGQKDHVRQHGRDFQDRLEQTFGALKILNVSEIFPNWAKDLMGLARSEISFFSRSEEIDGIRF